MRVTSRSLVDNVVRQLQSNAQTLDQIQNQVSTGKKITRPADDPVGTWKALRMRRDHADDTQLLRNVDEARNWLTANDQSLSQINDSLGRLRELAVQASDDSYTARDRAAIAGEAQQLQDQILSLVNGTTYVDQNVYSGLKTSSTPLVVDANGNTVYAGDTGITLPPTASDLTAANGLTGLTLTDAASATQGNYQLSISAPIAPANTQVDVSITRYDAMGVAVPGATQTITVDIPTGNDLKVVDFSQLGITATLNSAAGAVPFGQSPTSQFTVGDAQIAREIAPGVKMPVNMLASRFLTMFQDLKNLNLAMTTNNQPKISQGIADIDTALKMVLTAQGDMGTRLNRLDAVQSRTTNLDTEAQRIQGDTENVDMADALTRLTTQQAVYRAALQTGARTVPMSILDFLR